MEMDSLIFKNIIMDSLQIGTYLLRHQSSITVFGGMEQFQSITGTKRMQCNTTSWLVEMLVLMELEM